MSLSNVLKKAFGFTPETEEDDEYDSALPQYAAPAPPDTNTPSASSHNSNHHFESVSQKENASHEADDEVAVPDQSLPADLFDAIIELFNQAQPDFIKRCLNLEAQREYIIRSLSDKLRDRLDVALSAEKWGREKAELQKRIAALESGTVNDLRQENRRLELSVSRQKRALLDRINDLEAQVARHTEEKEKIFSSKPGSQALAKANAHIRRLEEEKASLIAAQNSSASSVSSDTESEKLRAELTDLSEECNRLKELAEKQSTLREQLEVKTAMSDKIINDLRNQLAQARNELQASHQEQETVLSQIQSQLDGFEDLKARKDAKISELQNSNSSLKRTIESNLYNHVEAEKQLRDEISGLKNALNEAEKKATEAISAKEEAEGALASLKAAANDAVQESTVAAEPSKGRKRGRPRKIKIDSDLDNTDWFTTAKDDPDFGYHEPPRRPVNDNEAQLSLF